MLDFIGLDDIADEVVIDVVNFSSFENMRAMEADNAFKHEKLIPADKDDPESYKTRKGKIGGFVDYLSPQEIQYLNHKIKEGLTDFYDYSV